MPYYRSNLVLMSVNPFYRGPCTAPTIVASQHLYVKHIPNECMPDQLLPFGSLCSKRRLELDSGETILQCSTSLAKCQALLAETEPWRIHGARPLLMPNSPKLHRATPTRLWRLSGPFTGRHGGCSNIWSNRLYLTHLVSRISWDQHGYTTTLTNYGSFNICHQNAFVSDCRKVVFMFSVI